MQRAESPTSKDVVTHARSRLVVLTVLCVAPLAPAAAQSDPGWTITTKMSLTSDSAGPTPTEMKIEVTKDHMRVSITGTAFRGPAAGMYMIFDGTHGTATSVLPSTQVAVIADMATLTNGANRFVKLDIKGEPTVQVHDLGAGQPMLGMPTHRYHVTTQYTTVLTMGAESCEKTYISDGDSWTTTTIDVATSLADAVSSMMGMGANAGLAKLHALRQSTPKGFALKWVGTSTTRSGNGKTVVSRGTTEVTEVAKSEIPSSRFTVPSDYRTTDVRNVAGRMDSSLMAKAMSSEAAVEGFKRVCAPDFKQP